MGSATAVIEISSDEEDGWSDPRAGKSDSTDGPGGSGRHPPDGGWRTPGAGRDKPSNNDGLEWAKKLLDKDDCDAIGEELEESEEMQELWASLLDETDIVVDAKNSLVDEPGKKNLRDDAEDGDNDDCVILDGDPEKKAVAVAKEEGPRPDATEDELQIVTEKGEIACRDFPHPRHLCASLAFSTTSHASHCSMCHCYVCDSLAPCAYWGKGTGINDHCHATDKDPIWKKLRQLWKSKSQQIPKLGGVQNLLQSSSTSTNVMIPPTRRFPVSSTGSQMQPVHPSITVSQNMGQGTLPRATSPMPRTKIWSNRSKRARVPPPVCTPSNVNYMQPTVPSYSPMQPAFPREFQTEAAPPGGTFVSFPPLPHSPPPPLSAPKDSQGYQGQQLRYPQVPPNTVVGTGVPLSRCTSLSTQGKQRPQGPSTDTTRLWKDALANLADKLGVPDYNIDPTPAAGQQSARVPSLTVMASVKASQGVKINPNCVAGEEPSRKRFSSMHNSSNHAAGSAIISGQEPSRKRLFSMHNSSNHAAGSAIISGQEPSRKRLPSMHNSSNHTAGSAIISSDTTQTKQPLCQLNSQSSVVPNETIRSNIGRSLPWNADGT